MVAQGSGDDTEAGLKYKRKDHEPPEAISRRGWKYHHMGIPTTVPHEGKRHIEHLTLDLPIID